LISSPIELDKNGINTDFKMLAHFKTGYSWGFVMKGIKNGKSILRRRLGGSAWSGLCRNIYKGKPTSDRISIKYLEAFEKIVNGQATKVFLPYEASSIISSIAGISEVLKEKASE